jgi:Fe-S oxidoreductase
MGVEAELMPTGCCGMAGSFGFEAEKHHWSMKIAERALLPKLRSAPEDTLIVADGFSCREQIEQSTGRPALHLAEVLRAGLARRA